MINNLPPLRVITLNKIPVYIRDVSDIEINSSLHILTEVEEIRLADFKCLKRKKTFLGVRTIVKELFPNSTIKYSEIGAPFLMHEQQKYISISHSQTTCSVSFIDHVIHGLDIEFHSGKASRLRSRFIHPLEEVLLEGEIEDTLAWSAKEALYKVGQSKKMIFKEQLRLLTHDRTKRQFKAEILFHDNSTRTYLIEYIIEGEFIVTLAIPYI